MSGNIRSIVFLLLILTFSILVTYGVVDTKTFLIIAIALTIGFVLISLTLVFMTCYYDQPERHEQQQQQQRQHEQINCNQCQREAKLLRQEELEKIEHFYASIY